MTLSEIRNRLVNEPNFINLKRFDYSLKKLLERYPEGCPVRVIAHALVLAEVEVEDLYQQAVEHLREAMGVEK